MSACGDGPDMGRNVEKQPVKEVHTGQGKRNLPALLVHIIALAGHVGVMADEDK
jgi:hypothetical protein